MSQPFDRPLRRTNHRWRRLAVRYLRTRDLIKGICANRLQERPIEGGLTLLAFAPETDYYPSIEASGVRVFAKHFQGGEKSGRWEVKVVP